MVGDVPVLETARLLLRGWRAEDVAPYAAMLADADTARFIRRSGRPASAAEAWGEAAFFIGHWQLLGFGMFVVEERGSGAFLGRVGPIRPPGWPGIEIAWALMAGARGNGFAVEAARAAIAWTFEQLQPPRIVSVIDPRNLPSRRVAERLGQERTGESFAPFGQRCDLWALTAEGWAAAGAGVPL